jgi:REP element-mobilizing transposase RayT
MHHVMNRGIARRPVFESRRGIRFFLSQVAREVHAGRLEVHAFCILTTHFHLMVTSPLGQLSKAMHRIENTFVRWFNRCHRRDGPLFRGRFGSKLVDTPEYECILVRYIDHNPVASGVVEDPRRYPYCSAYQWARNRLAPWLSTRWVMDWIDPWVKSGQSMADSYHATFGEPLTTEQTAWVDDRVRHQGDKSDPFADLVRASPPEVQKWMLRKAMCADGVQPGLQVVGRESIDEALRRAHAELESITSSSARNRAPIKKVLHVALLRDLCALSFAEAAATAGVSVPAAQRRYKRHAAEMADNPSYAAIAGETASIALRLFLRGQ